MLLADAHNEALAIYQKPPECWHSCVMVQRSPLSLRGSTQEKAMLTLESTVVCTGVLSSLWCCSGEIYGKSVFWHPERRLTFIAMPQDPAWLWDAGEAGQEPVSCSVRKTLGAGVPEKCSEWSLPGNWMGKVCWGADSSTMKTVRSLDRMVLGKLPQRRATCSWHPDIDEEIVHPHWRKPMGSSLWGGAGRGGERTFWSFSWQVISGSARKEERFRELTYTLWKWKARHGKLPLCSWCGLSAFPSLNVADPLLLTSWRNLI